VEAEEQVVSVALEATGVAGRAIKKLKPAENGLLFVLALRPLVLTHE
jgi:hypothetical protein